MNIRDLMTSDVQTVSPTDTAQKAAGVMLSAAPGSLPVCAGDRIVGLTPARAMALRGAAQGPGPGCPPPP